MAQVTGAHLGTTHPEGPARLDHHLETCLDVMTILGFNVPYPPRVLGWEAECQYWEAVGLFKGRAYCELAKATDLRRDQGSSSRSNPLLLPQLASPSCLCSTRHTICHDVETQVLGNVILCSLVSSPPVL